MNQRALTTAKPNGLWREQVRLWRVSAAVGGLRVRGPNVKLTGIAVAACAAFIGLQSSAVAATMLTMPTSAAAGCQVSGCLSDYGLLSRTFNAGNFSGPTRIGSFSFDRSMLGTASAFRLTFWTADGVQIGDFGSFDVSVLGGERLTLTGREFGYDPSQGNLIMRLQSSQPIFGAGGGGFSFGGGGFGGGSWSGGGGGGGSSAAALGISQAANLPAAFAPGPNAVDAAVALVAPEPTAWATMVLGFGVSGLWLRRRRTALVR